MLHSFEMFDMYFFVSKKSILAKLLEFTYLPEILKLFDKFKN